MAVEITGTAPFRRAASRVLLMLAVLVGTASAADSYRFERMWPTLHQPWYFSSPRGMATDSRDNLYVADAWNHRVTKFTPNGQFITSWGGMGSATGRLNEPSGIAVDGTDTVYVTDKFNHRVQKFTSDGTFLAAWGGQGTGGGQLDQPIGIGVDAEGDVFVAEKGNHRVQKFTADGESLGFWGGYGGGSGAFDAPSGLAAGPDRHVYVSDTGNHRVQVFDAAGNYITEWGSQGSQPGQFESPAEVFQDRSGVIYVADFGNHRIQGFARQGAAVLPAFSPFGSFGNAEGAFNSPLSICTDRQGNIFVDEYWNHRIQKFSPDRRFVTAWNSWSADPGMLRGAYGIARDTAGNVYLADTENHRVQKYGPAGQFLAAWGGHGAGNGQFDEPYGLDVDADGSIYVADTYNHRIQKLGSDGGYLTQWGGEGSGAGQFDAPTGIKVHGGHVYVADTNNLRIQKFTTEGVYVTQWDGSDSPLGSLGIIEWVWQDGEWAPAPLGPHGVAVNETEGETVVYVADTFNHRIVKFNSSGQYLSEWGSEGAGDGQFDRVYAVDVDGSGNVYAADAYNERVQWFDGGGAFLGKWGEKGTAPGQLRFPTDVAVTLSGDAYVVDYFNNRVQLFRRAAQLTDSRAVVVAGGGPYPGNNLWDATQTSANFAYRTLVYHGFTKDRIWYVSSDTDLDLDNNGAADDVDADATGANLRQALTQWAAGAETLVLYLVDHGGNGTFRMSGSETLSAGDLKTWLDQVQTLPEPDGVGQVIVVYDACESGTFVSELSPPAAGQRLVVTSTSPGENAYFITQGSVSFSNYFWTHVFNGENVRDAFVPARDAIELTVDHQHPLLDADGNGAGSEPDDFALPAYPSIGNGVHVQGETPSIAGISPAQTVTNGNSAALWADGVDDADGIARVWAVIRPPSHTPGDPGNPIRELPAVDLVAVPGQPGRYEAVYDRFDITGTYPVAIYARDRVGNTSQPQVTAVSVDNPLRRRAIIAAGGPAGGDLWAAVEKNVRLCWEALSFQGYRDDNIYLMSPAGIAGVAKTAVLPTRDNFQFAVEQWAGSQTRDLVVYLVGSGGSGTFQLAAGEQMPAADLDGFLDTLQGTLPGPVTVVYDACLSGSFLGPLAPPQGKARICIASTAADKPASFLAGGDISFSKFFWRHVLNGDNVRLAFLNARRSMEFVTTYRDGGKIVAQLDDSGNGVGNEKIDGIVAWDITIGAGIMRGGDEPFIGAVSPARQLSGEGSAEIWAENVTTTGTIQKVWAIVTPPQGTGGQPDAPVTGGILIDLAHDGTPGRHSIQYDGFTLFGTYDIAVYAMDDKGGVSPPAVTTVTQIDAPDPFENDDTPARAKVIVIDDIRPQRHHFHEGTDVDFVKFYGLAGNTYTLHALCQGCDVDIRIYNGGGANCIYNCDGSQWEGGSGELESHNLVPSQSGVFYVEVFEFESLSGIDTAYDVKVFRPTGPVSALFTGTVTDAYTGGPVGDALIRTTDLNFPASGISEAATGSYQLLPPVDAQSEQTLLALAAGYEDYSAQIDVPDQGTVVANITLVPVAELSHAISGLQVLVGAVPGVPVGKAGDLDGDGRFGLQEIETILQKLAGLR